MDSNDFWCHKDSPLIHPVGWSATVGHRIHASADYIASAREKAHSKLYDNNDCSPAIFTPPPTVSQPHSPTRLSPPSPLCHHFHSYIHIATSCGSTSPSPLIHLTSPHMPSHLLRLPCTFPHHLLPGSSLDISVHPLLLVASIPITELLRLCQVISSHLFPFVIL